MITFTGKEEKSRYCLPPSCAGRYYVATGLEHLPTENQIRLAAEIKSLFKTISPFFEKHTSKVCPLCKTVCCINKHGYYSKEDIFFLSVLKVDIPSFEQDGIAADPCKFLTEKGCSLQRWMRPFRCTWFFCDPLHRSMLDDNKRVYREFIQTLQKLISVRQKLIDLDNR